ncbi:unnamed protein product [Toxocara canis]|uniref:Deoxyhypusine synthase n=1 Tax=Toxocara canis TaxID=6265 RepID=A0A183VC78_TOXCA|nr:unnamed protein product [Toxocara canis]
MVEEKGKIYERSVHEFDTQAGKVASYPGRMPEDKENHQKEILETFKGFQYFDVLASFHQNAAAMLGEHLSRLGVQSPIDVAAAIAT